MHKSFGKNVLKGAGIVSFFSLIGKVMAFAQKLVMAGWYGTGTQADAFTLALNSVILPIATIPYKILAPFLPLFVERRDKEGEASAWRFAGTVTSLLGGSVTVVMLVGILAAPMLVRALSNFASETTTNTAITLVRIMLPATLILSLYHITTYIMHAHKRFGWPAIGDALNRITIIGVFVAGARFFGVNALAYGVVTGALVCLLLQLYGLRRELPLIRFTVNWQDPALREFWLLMPPVLLSILAAQGRNMLDNWFTSGMGEGFTASLGYAKGFTDTITLLVPFAVGVVLYPYFADLTDRARRDEFTATLMTALRLMAFLFLPLSALFVALRVPIIQLAYQRGSFSMESVAMTADPVLYFALGLTVFALEIILMRVFFAMKKIWAPALVGIACVAVHVGIILLLKPVMHYPHSSIAVARTVSMLVKVFILFVLLRPLVSGLRLRENAEFFGKTLLAALSLGVVAYAVFALTAPIAPLAAGGGKILAAVALAACLGVATLAGGTVFAILAFILHIPETRGILALVKGGRKRGAETASGGDS